MPSLAIDSMLTLKKSLINTLENELFFCQPTSGITKEKLFKSNKRCTGWTNRYFQTSAWATFKRKKHVSQGGYLLQQYGQTPLHKTYAGPCRALCSSSLSGRSSAGRARTFKIPVRGGKGSRPKLSGKALIQIAGQLLDEGLQYLILTIFNPN